MHADGRFLLAAALEELAGVVQATGYELVGVGEIDRLDAQRTGRRQDDQVSVSAVALNIVDQAAVGEQADGV